MKTQMQPLRNVSPQFIRALALRSSDSGKRALAAFLKTLIQERYRNSTTNQAPSQR